MKILAFDASTEALSVALRDSAVGIDAEYFEIAPQAHARRLLPLAQQLLGEHGLVFADLDGLAFARGPGAFTGLRIAAGLVQGLAGGLDRPVFGVSTLAALALACFDDTAVDGVRVVQDARMGEVYWADYERGDAGAPVLRERERVLAPAELPGDDHGLGRAGNGWALVAAARGEPAEALAVAEVWPHARSVARLAADGFARGEGRPAAAAVPVYVRDDVARRPAPPKTSGASR